MSRMTKEEYLKFLSEGTKTAHLATVREDGRPHVVPIWFVMDGDKLVFNTGVNTVKGKNLKRNPEVCISVDNPNPPYDFVQIQGKAKISEDLDEMLIWATIIGARYMGVDKAEKFGKRNAVPGELLVKVNPTKIIAEKNVTAW